MSKSEYKNNINKKANDGNINSYSSANQNAKGPTHNETSEEDRVHAKGREGEGIKFQHKKTDNVLKGKNKEEFSKETAGQIHGERNITVDNIGRQGTSPNNYGPNED
jgi:hypothetical protein